jgi:hypothetical protein
MRRRSLETNKHTRSSTPSTIQSRAGFRATVSLRYAVLCSLSPRVHDFATPSAGHILTMRVRYVAVGSEDVKVTPSDCNSAITLKARPAGWDCWEWLTIYIALQTNNFGDILEALDASKILVYQEGVWERLIPENAPELVVEDARLKVVLKGECLISTCTGMDGVLSEWKDAVHPMLPLWVQYRCAS